jgi:hypothetical protein
MTRSLFALVMLLGCAGSHGRTDDAGISPCDGGGLPPEVVGSFTFVQRGCGRLPNESRYAELGYLYVGVCGEAQTGVPDGPETRGTVHAEGDAFVYDADELSLTLRPMLEPPIGYRILEVESTIGNAWAMAARGSGRYVDAPSMRTCGMHETWSTHQLAAGSIGAMLEQGDDILEPGDSQPTARIGADMTATSSTIVVADPRLPIAWWFVGVISEWDGRTGRAWHGGAPSGCTDLDSDITFEWDGTTFTTTVEWLVPDVSDLDRDSDTLELLVRRSRMESTREACAD